MNSLNVPAYDHFGRPGRLVVQYFWKANGQEVNASFYMRWPENTRVVYSVIFG